VHRIYKYLFFIILLNIPIQSNAHIEHYNNLNKIEFDIYRNNKYIGQHKFTFVRLNNNEMSVESEINFKIEVLGVVLYKYHVKGIEYFKDGNLVKFTSKTYQNGKKKYVNLKLEEDQLIIDGSSFKGKVPANYLVGTWWNHSIINAEVQISAVSGRIIKQNVTFLGKKKININGKDYKTLHFNFSSIDKDLTKGKKLNTDIWYEEKTLNLVKVSFKKKGYWEYKLKKLK